MLSRKGILSIYLLFIILSIFLIGQKKSENGYKPSVKKITLYTDSLVNTQIEIENRGAKSAAFLMKVNNGFYFTENEMLEEIKNMKPEFQEEGLERKAWRYVIRNVKYAQSLGSENWLHTPSLMVNSIGNGLCDDLAATLNLIWKKLGFQSRVWDLGGHVVPEVYVNNRWQMYDPAHGVFYLNNNNQIAGVEELSEHPELIVNPKNRLINNKRNPLSVVMGYSKVIAEIYSSDSNNYVNNWYDNFIEPGNQLFSLPAGATMMFPVSYGKIPGTNVYRLPEYSFLSVYITSDKKTELEIPLVLYAIEGKGKVSIDSLEFQIGSDELKNYLKNFSVFHHQLVFQGEPFSATIYYLINKRSVAIEERNNLVISGLEIDNVFAKILKNKIAVSESCLSLVDSIIIERFKEYEEKKEQYNRKLSPFLSGDPTMGNLMGMANVFISSDNKLNAAQKKEILSAYEKTIMKVLVAFPVDKYPKVSVSLFSDPYFVIVCLGYIQYCNEEELMKFIMNR